MPAARVLLRCSEILDADQRGTTWGWMRATARIDAATPRYCTKSLAAVGAWL
jgi:hypothetical protein